MLGCREPHMLRDFPHRKHDGRKVYNVQEEAIVNDVARSVPRIYAVVENGKQTTKPLWWNWKVLLLNNLSLF
jgi:hypothetical protein